MPLQRGEVLGYDFNRMVVDFTMLNQGKTVKCAISTAAMDNLEGTHDVKADQRVDQFVRLRDAIEERASRKFSERLVEAEGPVVLRSNDFFRQLPLMAADSRCKHVPKPFPWQFSDSEAEQQIRRLVAQQRVALIASAQQAEKVAIEREAEEEWRKR